MEAKSVNLNEWEEFGAGGIGRSYFNKTDDSVILKLNAENWPKEKTELEVIYSQEVQKLGLPTPSVYSFVTDGTRYGHIDQRIKGKKSMARIMSQDPSKIEEFAKVMAQMTRQLNETKCNTEVFQNLVKAYTEAIEAIPCNEDIKKQLRAYMAMMENTDGCLHGDLQPGNVITADGKFYWIDLGGFGYGDPCLDFGNMYLLLYIMPPQLVKSLFHMKHKDFERFFQLYLRYYYGGEPSAEVMEKIKGSAYVKAGIVVGKFPKIGKMILPLLEGKTIKFKLIRFIASFAKIEL